MNKLFPIFLKADKIEILIIGAGATAAEKLHFLLKSSPNATITIVSKGFSPKVLRLLERNHKVRVIYRSFRKDDLINKHLIVSATNDYKLNLSIFNLTRDENILLNVADQPEFCDFYLGGIVTKGDLKIAISTNGKSPILAKRMRQYLENEIPNNVKESIDLTSKLRHQLKGTFIQKLQILNNLTSSLIEEK